MPRVNIQKETLVGLGFFTLAYADIQEDTFKTMDETMMRLVAAKAVEILAGVCIDIYEDDPALFENIIKKEVMPVAQDAASFAAEGVSLEDAARVAHRLRR